MSFHRLKPLTSLLQPRIALPLVFAGVLAGAGLWRWYELRQPERVLAAGLAALDANQRLEVERIAGVLAGRGRLDSAAYLRARLEQHQGDRLAEEIVAESRQAARFELLSRAARAVASAGFQQSGSGGAVHALSLADFTAANRPQALLGKQEQVRAYYAGALLQLQQIPAHSPLAVEAAIVAGQCFFRLGQGRLSARAWEFVLTSRAEHAEAHRHLAAIYYDLGAMPRALRHLEELARLEAADGRPHRQIGLIWKDEKQSRLAIEAYREALRRRLAPEARAEVIRELAELWLGEGETDYREALAVLDLCPPEFAARPEYLALRADALWKSHLDEPRAFRLITEALRKDPDSLEALVVRARMHLDVDEPAQAVPLLERARRLGPHLLPVRIQLALAWQRLDHDLARAGPACGAVGVWLPAAVREGLIRPRAEAAQSARDEHQRRIEAISALGREAMEKPWDDELRVRIGRLWLELENPLLARTWFNAALVCNPENTEAVRALEAIAGRGGP